MDDDWWDDFVRHIVDRAQTSLRCDSCGPGSSDWYCRACVREREDVIRDIARAIGFDGETDAELVEEARSIARQRDEARAERLQLQLTLDARWSLAREIEALLGIPSRAPSDEQLRLGFEAVRRLVRERDEARAEVERLRAELDQARAAVGEAWLAGGATLAEAIQRKCSALESLGNPRT